MSITRSGDRPTHARWTTSRGWRARGTDRWEEGREGGTSASHTCRSGKNGGIDARKKGGEGREVHLYRTQAEVVRKEGGGQTQSNSPAVLSNNQHNTTLSLRLNEIIHYELPNISKVSCFESKTVCRVSQPQVCWESLLVKKCCAGSQNQHIDILQVMAHTSSLRSSKSQINQPWPQSELHRQTDTHTLSPSHPPTHPP